MILCKVDAMTLWDHNALYVNALNILIKEQKWQGL